MRKYFFLLFFTAIQLSHVVAQKIVPAATPEAAGLSSERLKRLDKEMNDWVQQEWMQGGVALVIRNGKIAYYKAVGYKDLATKLAMQKDDIFRLASQTKAITSVAMMILLEEGKFLLDDAVSKYIPAFKKQQVLDKFNGADTTYTTVPAKQDITIRQLLTHTSGIGYAQIGSREANAIYGKSKLTAGLGVHDDTLLNAMNRLAKLPLMHQPGEKWTYGLNYDLLGCLVEVISGMSLSDFFSTRIFEPLGMKDTYFRVPGEKAARLVPLYGEAFAGKEKLTKAPDNLQTYPLEPQTYYSGGSGLSSSIYDYGVFLQMILNNGQYDNNKRLLSRNTVRLMTMNQIGDTVFRGNDKFGLGFQVVTEKGSGRTPSQMGTFSWSGAFSTFYWVDPKEKMILLFYRQLQFTTHTDLVEKFRSLVYQAIND